MITIKAEWVQKTKMGRTQCSADKTVFRNYRDVEHVEEVVEWVKKLFSNKEYSDQVVDFLYDNDTAYGFTNNRFIKEWNGTYFNVYFGGYANGIKNHMDKLTKAEIKKAYLDIADKCLDFEEEKANECAD